MKINITEPSKAFIVAIDGRIDSSNAGELDQKLQMIIENGNYNIVVDMSQVTFLSSMGLRALIRAKNSVTQGVARNGNVLIAQPSEIVQDVFETAGLSKVFDVYESVEAARSAL